MVFDKLKTFVGQSAGKKVGNALTTASGSPSSSQSLLAKVFAETASKMFEDKEWQCPCGHKFRASGEWIACAPIYCEVPSCPNPKYYISGPGRALLEANPSGVKLEEVKGGAQIPPPTAGSKSGVGSRFR
ncbi:hypothetical protein STCU_00214 [Strigomonas culicis]|uniref:Uncharacterized protein n=1 Tax=Strigomonas culicis TaxID=28005 RepID=S9V8G9_9TRYP|nr:hypothetical protein STCU_00214 [Strigomonas culicis]|eukprot:EPY37083.1 hypothetical protein STCU_00214 [Strigomonas culicis]